MGKDKTRIEGDEEEKFSETALVEHICKTLNTAISDRKPFDGLVDKWYNDWRDIKGEKIWPWKGCHNYSVPISSTSADSIIPRIIEGIFDFETPIEAKPMNKTAQAYKDIIQLFVAWDLDAHSEELHKQIWFFVQNAVWSGTGFMKVFFEKEKAIKEREIYTYVDAEGEIITDKEGKAIGVNDKTTAILQEQGVNFTIKQTTEKKLRWKKYNPCITCIDIKDVVIPSDCVSVQDAWDNSLLAVRQWRTKDFLMRQLRQDDKELFKNLDKVKIKELEAKIKNTQDRKEQRRLANYASKTKKIETFEVYLNYDVDNDGLEEKIVAIVNLDQKLLLGWEKYDYDHEDCPVIPGYIKPIHRQLYGVGVPEMLFDTKGEVDDIHNNRRDREDLYSSPILTHTKASGFNRSAHKPGPGRHWRLKDRSANAIGYLENPSRERQSIEEENLALGYSQKRTGVTDYALGTESNVASNKTASGIMALIEEGNKGFRHFIRWISLAIAKICQQRFDLYQQFWGKMADEEVQEWLEEILDIPDNPLDDQTIDAIKHKFNLVIAATKQSKNLEMKKAQVAYDSALANPLFQQAPEFMREITVHLFRSVGIKEPESKVPSVEQIRQIQVDIQKQALEQMEAEIEERNIQAAGEKGYQEEKLRLGAFGGQR